MSKSKNKSDNKTEKALAAEKEQFGKQQLHSISKTVTSTETPPKEKYVRNIIIGTYKEAGATTFWSYSLNLPLSSHSMVSWKFCYLLHKVLRGGHRNCVRDSHRYCHNIKDMGILWGNLHDRYGHIVALSAKYLCLKIEFHAKHTVIPGHLEVSDETLEREAGTDMTKVLDMTQEMLDYLDAGLKMSETVLRQLDANGAKSTTPAGQCRLTPLIPLILDCSFLYHFSVLLMFKLHSRIAPDVLLGHRERFRDLFTGLAQFFDRAREMEFFKSIIRIPDLPDGPPNFLRAAALGEYKKAVVVMPNEERLEEEVEPQPEAQQIPQYYLMNQMAAPDEKRNTENESLKRELEVLKPELKLIKTEAQRAVIELKSQVNRLEAEMEEQRTHKQMAMMENEHLRMEVDALRSANVASVGAQIGFKEADTRAQAAELRFTQLKDRHAELISSHADLMKKSADTVKLLSNTKQSQDDLLRAKQQLENELEYLRQEKRNMMNQLQEVERLNKELLEQRAELALLRSTLENKEREGSQASSSLAALQAERDVLLRSAREKDSELSLLRQQAQHQQGSLDLERDRLNRELESLRAQLQQQLTINAEQKLEIDRLRRELDSTRAELTIAKNALQSKEMSGTELSSSLAGLQAEREVLMRSMREQETELNSLRQQAQLHQGSLEQERQRSSMELGNLHAQLQQQACREGELTRKLQEEQFCLLQCAVVEAEGIILDAVAKVDDPIHVCCISSPDYLVNRAEITLGSIDKMQQSHQVYVGNRNDASGLLRTVTQFSHLAADTIVNGAATSHSAPTDQADCLTDSCRDCANHCLQFLKDLKLQASLPRADPSAIRYTVQRLLALAQELRPKGQDVRKEELGSMVDKEMIATSTAIEEAVLRMDEILNQARRDTSGVKLEVNQSILGSCSDLMKAVHMLVTASTDLQKDIVEGGRGAASVTEFYAKNSCWTEGLISASKAVGWGATQLLDSADRFVDEKGTHEELIACCHEIAASTAQLVAASKVKADRNNKKLSTLQQASRHVNDMAAVVVTSTKHGQRRTSEGVMDFSGMSLIKLKTEEMEAQVKVLQLENQLEQERVRLGELRKRHYELNSPETSVADSEDGSDSFPPPPPPTLLDSTPVPQSFSQTQPHLNTQSFAPTNPFAPATTVLPPQAYTPSHTQSYTPPQSNTPSTYTPPQSNTPSTYTPPQSNTPSTYTPPQSNTPSTYTPPQSNTPSTYTPPQSNTPSTYTPPQSYTPSTYTPPQSYTPSTYTLPQSDTPSTYTPPQTFSTSQPYITSQPYVPSQPYTPIQSQSLLNPSSYSLSQPSSNTSSQTNPQTLSPPQTTSQTITHSPKLSLRKPNIFTKSGNLLKKTFKRGETGSGES
ncbi:huntingtin-interacting protein 1-related protein [Tautogolabrus adspersus]